MDKKLEIDANKFSELLHNQSFIQNFHVTESVHVSSVYFSPWGIKDCIFTKEINLDKIKTYNSIVFENCTFKNALKIENTDSIHKVLFKNCICESEIVINNSSFANTIFDEGDYSNIILIGNLNTKTALTNDITFKNGNFTEIMFKQFDSQGKIDIGPGKYDNINFYRCKIFEDFIVDEPLAEISSLDINNVEFSNRFFLHQSKKQTEGRVYINEVVFNGRVSIKSTYFTNSLDFTSVIAKQKTSINYNGNISHLTLTDSKFDGSLNCYYSKFDDEKRNTNETMICTLNGTIQGNIVFEDIYIGMLFLGCVNLGSIVFNGIFCNWIFINDCHNKGKLMMSNLKYFSDDSAFIIVNSSIADSEFINIDFNKFKDVVITKSDVSGMRLSNSNFPKKIQINAKNPLFGYGVTVEDNINHNLYFRESYRQLKISMEKQGNIYAALHYRNKEMHYLRMELKWSWDKILLSLNHISNNHGLSWTRGFVFTILISIVCFNLYNITLVTPFFVWDFDSDVSQILKSSKTSIDAYFSFITKFPSLDLAKRTTWITNFVVLFSRITIGYGIYQTIVAFRKYGAGSVKI